MSKMSDKTKLYTSYRVDGHIVLYRKDAFVVELDNDCEPIDQLTEAYMVCPLTSYGAGYEPLCGIYAESHTDAFAQYLLDYNVEVETCTR